MTRRMTPDERGRGVGAAEYLCEPTQRHMCRYPSAGSLFQSWSGSVSLASITGPSEAVRE